MTQTGLCIDLFGSRSLTPHSQKGRTQLKIQPQYSNPGPQDDEARVQPLCYRLWTTNTKTLTLTATQNVMKIASFSKRFNKFSGLYYKHITNITMIVKVMSQLRASLYSHQLRFQSVTTNQSVTELLSITSYTLIYDVYSTGVTYDCNLR